MKNPAVSIIVPLYNTEHFLPRCLDSLINQTFRDIEIICVNDGSPDNAAAVCRGYAADDPRISLISQTNQGLSAARNAGLALAKGSLIQFCDSDDSFDPAMCEKLHSALLSSGADTAVSGINLVYEDAPPLPEEHLSYYKTQFNGMRLTDDETFKTINVFAHNKIFKKSLLDQYGVIFPYGLRYEDAAFTFKYLMIAKSVFYIEDNLYNYTIRPGSIMDETRRNKPPYALDHINVMRDIYYFMHTNNLEKRFMQLFVWMVKEWTKTACSYSDESLHQKAVHMASELLKTADYNTLLNDELELEALTQLYALKNNNPLMFAEYRKLNDECRKLNDEVKALRFSRSYRIGRALTWTPRKIAEIIRKKGH